MGVACATGTDTGRREPRRTWPAPGKPKGKVAKAG